MPHEPATLQPLDELLARYPDLEPCRQDVSAGYELLRDCFRGGGKLLVCGNGGSAADSEHIVGELMKGFKKGRPVPEAVRRRLRDQQAVASPAAADADYLADHLQGALPAISLVSQTALVTAFANDVAADMVFAQQVYGYGREGDALLGISTSGNSANVLHALVVARAQGLATLGLAGRDGGRMSALCDACITIPMNETLEIQERHLPVYHALCDMLERTFFPD